MNDTCKKKNIDYSSTIQNQIENLKENEIRIISLVDGIGKKKLSGKINILEKISNSVLPTKIVENLRFSQK